MKKRYILCLAMVLALLTLLSACGSGSIMGAWKGDPSEALTDSYTLRQSGAVGAQQNITIPADAMFVFKKEGVCVVVTDGYKSELQWSQEDEDTIAIFMQSIRLATLDYTIEGSKLTIVPEGTDLPMIYRRATSAEAAEEESARQVGYNR